MNSGLIAHRYGQAFLDLVNEHGTADSVYEQARTILSAMKKVEKFRLAITDAKAVTLQKKESLLRACVAPSDLHAEFLDLLALMHRNGRTEFYRLALLDFLQLYRQDRGIVMVQLTTAHPHSGMEPMVSELLKREYGQTPVVRNVVNPDILGGFICETWGYRLDASVRRSLEDLKEEMIEINRRLV